jgi:hypothetical protein
MMKYLLVRDHATEDFEQHDSLPREGDTVYALIDGTWWRYTYATDDVGSERFLVIDSRGGCRTTDRQDDCDYNEELCFMWDEPNYCRCYALDEPSVVAGR